MPEHSVRPNSDSTNESALAKVIHLVPAPGVNSVSRAQSLLLPGSDEYLTIAARFSTNHRVHTDKEDWTREQRADNICGTALNFGTKPST